MDSYGYDEAGNTDTRTIAGDEQTLDWDAEGHLAKVTQPDGSGSTKTTSYVYDADGNRLISRTSTETTLYLGNTEITLAKDSTTPTATRYYDLGSGNQAVRTNDNKLYFLISDQNGTSQLAINATDLTIQQRRSTPFGAPRGPAPTAWPGTKGFVGGAQDTTTGLTHLGAREYDPTTGRFLSVDPVLDLTDPQQINGYAYANNSPVTRSDPSGQFSFSGLVKWICGIFRCGNSSGTMGSVASSGISSRGSGGSSSNGSSSTPITTVSDHSSDSGCRIVMNLPYCWGGANDPGPIGTYSEIEYWDNLPCAQGESQWLCTFRREYGKWMSLVFGDLLSMMGPGGKARTKAYGLDEEDDGGVRNPCNSFLPGTQVLLADGTRKDIEDVQIGDKVTATDPKTGKTTTRKVVATIITKNDKDFTDITVKTGHGDASIIATDHHPFWSTNQHKWIDAVDLHPGDRLRTPNGHTAEVAATRHYHKQQTTRNLTINGIHTYYVLADKTPVLVHNSGPCAKLNLPFKDPDLRKQVSKVVTQMDLDGTLPPGVRQGGTKKAPGIYGGEGLPAKPNRYYVETDVWPTPEGMPRSGSGRLIFGAGGEVYYTGHYKDGFVRIR